MLLTGNHKENRSHVVSAHFEAASVGAALLGLPGMAMDRARRWTVMSEQWHMCRFCFGSPLLEPLWMAYRVNQKESNHLKAGLGNPLVQTCFTRPENRAGRRRPRFVFRGRPTARFSWLGHTLAATHATGNARSRLPNGKHTRSVLHTCLPHRKRTRLSTPAQQCAHGLE